MPEPITSIQPMKPEGTFRRTEFADLDNLWDNWASERVSSGIAVEPKINGMRVVLQSSEGEVKISFGSGEDRTDHSNNLPNLSESLRNLDDDVILDGELIEVRDGDAVPRVDLGRFRSEGEVDDSNAIVLVFDALYANGEELQERAWEERQEALNELGLGSGQLRHLSPRIIESRDDLERAVREALEEQGSEGALLKEISSTYTFGESDAWAKLKRTEDIQAVVLSKEENEGGTLGYEGGIAIPDDRVNDFSDTQELDGSWFISLGQTFNTSLDVGVGDVIEVAVSEVNFDDEDGSLTASWQEPEVKGEAETPSDLGFALEVARLLGGRVPDQLHEQLDELDEVFSEWQKHVNMTASELRRWSQNPCSREASVDPEAVIERNLRLLERNKDEWTAEDIEDAKRTISFISRMRPNEPGDPRDGPKGCPSEWAISLLNWAFNPFDSLPGIPEELREQEDELPEEGEQDGGDRTDFMAEEPSGSTVRGTLWLHANGMEPDNVDLSLDELQELETSEDQVIIHGDLRFNWRDEGESDARRVTEDNYLEGVTIFLDNQSEAVNKLTSQDKIGCTIKQKQPAVWGVRDKLHGRIFAPGEIGNTRGSDTWGKMYFWDQVRMLPSLIRNREGERYYEFYLRFDNHPEMDGLYGISEEAAGSLNSPFLFMKMETDSPFWVRNFNKSDDIEEIKDMPDWQKPTAGEVAEFLDKDVSFETPEGEPGQASLRESVATQSRIGVVTEQDDGEVGSWTVAIIRQGFSLNAGNHGPIFYGEETLAESAAIFEGARVNAFSFQSCDEDGQCEIAFDHLPPDLSLAVKQGEIPAPVKEIVGFLRNVHYSESQGALIGTLELSSHAAWLDRLLQTALAQGDSNVLGLSIDILAHQEPDTIDGQSATRITEILDADAWVDVVDHPAAGGEILGTASESCNGTVWSTATDGWNRIELDGNKVVWHRTAESGAGESQTNESSEQQEAKHLDELLSDLEDTLGDSLDEDTRQRVITMVRDFVQGLPGYETPGEYEESNEHEEEPDMPENDQTVNPEEQTEQDEAALVDRVKQLEAELAELRSDASESETSEEAESEDDLTSGQTDEAESEEEDDNEDPKIAELQRQLDELRNEKQQLSEKLGIAEAKSYMEKAIEEKGISSPVAKRIRSEVEGQNLSTEQIDQVIEREQEWFNTYLQSESIVAPANPSEEADTQEKREERKQRARQAREGLSRNMKGPSRGERASAAMSAKEDS